LLTKVSQLGLKYGVTLSSGCK